MQEVIFLHPLFFCQDAYWYCAKLENDVTRQLARSPAAAALQWLVLVLSYQAFPEGAKAAFYKSILFSCSRKEDLARAASSHRRPAFPYEMSSGGPFSFE
ncbi:hypothetical protein [Pontibacter beigongshangensis]|uniref:hypothetical protein n=1 Tax=Pontibacter beigongshangensis TaxID=2574733 RepID=UPI00164EF015|nr:hypothetical protein [Pontibacter beigongshangensis]